MNISDEALDFLREQYEYSLKNWFDDPDEQFINWTHTEFIEWYDKMIRIGREIGVEFWSVEVTDFEIDRVQEMLKVAGHKHWSAPGLAGD